MTDEWANDGLHFLCQNRANCLTVIQMVGEAPHSMISSSAGTWGFNYVHGKYSVMTVSCLQIWAPKAKASFQLCLSYCS